MIWGYPYFWKHPYIYIYTSTWTFQFGCHFFFEKRVSIYHPLGFKEGTLWKVLVCIVYVHAYSIFNGTSYEQNRILFGPNFRIIFFLVYSPKKEPSTWRIIPFSKWPFHGLEIGVTTYLLTGGPSSKYILTAGVSSHH